MADLQSAFAPYEDRNVRPLAPVMRPFSVCIVRLKQITFVSGVLIATLTVEAFI